MKLIVLLCVFAACSAFAQWTVLENCRLVENRFNDADSFLVECDRPFQGKTCNRFRLYFVDAAETDARSAFKSARLAAQAAYWGRKDPAFALQMGLLAKQSVQRLLKGRFTLYTQGETAPSSGVPRYYAMIRIRDRWLSELLVEEGLVRLYGKGVDLPFQRTEQQYWRFLHRLERAAKMEQRNGWVPAAD